MVNGDGMTDLAAPFQSVIRAVNHHPRAVEVLHDLYAHGPPVHLVLSATDEFGLVHATTRDYTHSRELNSGSKLKAFLTSPDPSSQRTCYSLQWIEKGGHMVNTSQRDVEDVLTHDADSSYKRCLKRLQMRYMKPC